jgi:hypothetical protein
VHGRLHDADQGLLAAGQLGAHGLAEVGDAEPLQPGRRRGARVGQAVQLAVHAQVLVHPQPLGQGKVPGREPDLLHGRDPAAGQAMAADGDRALVGLHHTEAHEQGGRLAGAVGTQQRDPLALADAEIDPVDGTAPAILLDQAAGHENVRHTGQSTSRL